MEKVDCAVVGAGVVGLAAARALALAGREVIVLEAHDCIGSELSSRNSEVIHAGIYYPGASLKARFCVDGRNRLYDYCEQHNVPFRRCGKLIIATSEQQRSELEVILGKARANGVDDIVPLDRDEALAREPQVRCCAALWSPSTGIIDSHSYMLALQGELEDAGGTVVFNSTVTGGRVRNGALEIGVLDGNDCFRLAANTVVNCAGIGGDKLAGAFEGIDRKVLPEYSYAKGNYFTCSGESPFSSLIYPVPNEYGLGIHVTLDIAGNIRFGPDVEWVDELNYEVDPERGDSFYEAICSYWPGVKERTLYPAYSGIRPKINGQGLPAADFCIQHERDHGVAGLINLFGIESPGLTSSLALADYVRDLACGFSG